MNIKIILILNLYFFCFMKAETEIKDESTENNFNSTSEEINGSELESNRNQTSLEINEINSNSDKSVEIENEISTEMNLTDSSSELNIIENTTAIFETTSLTSIQLPEPTKTVPTFIPILSEISSTTYPSTTSSIGSITNENNSDKFNLENDIHFRLYNTQTYCQNVPEIILNNKESILSSNFNPTLPTRFLIHDWDSYAKCEFTMMIKDAYLSNSNHNIIIVDWEKISLAPYQQAQNNSIKVGQIIGNFIDFLYINGNLNLSDVYLIGYGLGAHIAGIAGRSIKYNKISVIYGLDPIQLRIRLFEKSSNRYHNNVNLLRKTDALYVEIIYTSHIISIYQEPAGHSNFYVNLGKNQPGCDLNLSCGHARAYRYFAESIISRKEFIGVPCRSYREIILAGICRRLRTPVGIMGGRVANRFNFGIFDVPVNSKSPHAIGIF